jgi:gluconolactonase
MATGRVFYDGLAAEPRLDHPEGVAVAPDGSVWCGGEAGQLFRIDPDGGGCRLVASTGGFVLGIAFGGDGELYACDQLHRAVFRLEDGRLDRFCAGSPDRPFRVPNAVAAGRGGELYVSDSHGPGEPGPGIYRIAADGSAALWYGEALDFANGVALAPDGSALYVVESFLPGVVRIPIAGDGGHGTREVVVRLDGTVPDGIAFGPDGRLYIGCYEPSQVLRVGDDGSVETVLHDPTAHLLCHPTNLAFRGSTLFTANLGRWHITAIEGL